MKTINLKLVLFAAMFAFYNTSCEESKKIEDCSNECCEYTLGKEELKLHNFTSDKGDGACYKLKVEPTKWYQYKFVDYKNDQVLDLGFFIEEAEKGNFTFADSTIHTTGSIQGTFLACDNINSIFAYIEPEYDDGPIEYVKDKFDLILSETEGVNDGAGYCNLNLGTPPILNFQGKVGPIKNENNKRNFSPYEFPAIEGNVYQLKLSNISNDISVNFTGDYIDVKNRSNYEIEFTFTPSFSNNMGLNIQSLNNSPATYEISIEDLGPAEP